MKPTTQRYQLRGTTLRELQQVLDDVSLRLANLESVAGVEVLPDVTLQTGATVTPAVPPFPARVSPPSDYTPKGLLLLNLVNESVSSTGGVSTGPVSLWWHAVPGELRLDYVAGLSINTRYRLTLGAVRG